MQAPERQQARQQPLAAHADAGDLIARGPEQYAGRHLHRAEPDADQPLVDADHVTREREHQGYGTAYEEITAAEPVVPAIGEPGREHEADGRDGGDTRGDARLLEVEDEHVDELEALGQRVCAPGQQQILKEADAV